MPQEVIRPARHRGPGERVDADLSDGLATFVERKPAWVGADGYPLTWGHYVQGMAEIARTDARRALMIANAVRAANADEAGWVRFTAEMENAAR